MINFGGRFSINALFNDPAYRAGVRVIEDRTRCVAARRATATAYASCVWCFDKIRERTVWAFSVIRIGLRHTAIPRLAH